ncbi:MAG: hypothetical protein NC489_17280 [Ruminococcus flavefaciens]|nr:hypothetical protein [Ruminococcus flavefaciens]
MTGFKQLGFTFRMLRSGLSDFLKEYWNTFEEKELSGCKTDGGNNRNHCVYEQRINSEKICSKTSDSKYDSYLCKVS